MNPTLDPPAQAARSVTDEAIRLMLLYQDVSASITGKTRWLGNQRKLREGKCRWRGTFKKLAAELRIWKFDAEAFMRWAISTHEVVIDRPNTIGSDWLLGKYNQHRGRSMADAVVEDKTVRGKMDLIRTDIEADVENLYRWQNFMPDYKQRLLNQYQSLSSYFLATDSVFHVLMNEGVVDPPTIVRVAKVIEELNGDKWFYQQVRQTRDRAIMAAGK